MQAIIDALPLSARSAFVLAFGVLGVAAASGRVDGSETSRFALPSEISSLLKANCLDCHTGGDADGGVRLDTLTELDTPARLDLLNRAQVQIFTDQMPPDDKLPPKDSDTLLAWVSGELGKHGASTLEDKLRYYRYANYIDHDKLFSGDVKDMPFTPARRWKINQFIYEQLVYDIFRDRKRNNFRKFKGMVQVFTLPSESGVKYYDTEAVEGSEFLTLLDNAKYIVGKHLLTAKMKNGFPKPPSEYVRRQGTVFQYRTTDPEFETLILTKGTPSEADIKAAIVHWFELVLARPPAPDEMARYLNFMHMGIESGTVTNALENMMISVLMEPDFVYRSEFGDGKPDAFGRTKLTPREASYALAYALTDCRPDDQLVAAARSGKLSTKEDYRREVLRMLADTTLEKPRILRFFQDYFGYYEVFNIFKDEIRFGGSYNPHRASAGKFLWRAPEKVTKEADLLVMSILKEDKDVLKQLLTTDKYFVHHSGDNEQMAQVSAETDKIVELYKPLHKETWREGEREAAEKAVAEALGKSLSRAITTGLLPRYDPARPDRKLLPLYHSDTMPHAVSMYNLDPNTWSYEPVQPFKVEGRMGMLTHPAWLISFSKNAETDLIRRGKWIQEKLLAGIVPDLPIAVEAKVPEHPHQTLRQRISSVTEHQDCVSCHRRMNPLGYPFESFDDFGRFRTEEPLENPENVIKQVDKVLPGLGSNTRTVATYKTLPVSTTGALAGTGDPKLDGEVKDAFDLIDRLAQSERVRQSFVRNVFRYFMGRNEMVSDSKTLIEADRAYVESGGSFQALIVSLLTSDSFMYRK